MIRFACICGHRLEVEDDQAGAALQCPKCGLLTDVPNLSDLQSFTDEGTYRIESSRPIADDPDRIAELEIIYAKTKHDAEGNEIDLRTLPAGRPLYGEEQSDEEGELELKPAEPDITTRPKYDPETGELIRPLDLQKDPLKDVNPASIPMAKAAINYASGQLAKRISPLSAAVELLMPMNLVVMFFVFCTHVFSGMMFVVMLSLLLFLIPAWIFLQALLLSHYGNVIDDTGRNEQDDLPRPLRDLSWYDDIWSPFVSMFFGLTVAFVIPTTVLVTFAQRLHLPVPQPVMWIAAAMIGTVFGPAILLTTNTSGSILNLRPDRVLGVIRICGAHYIGLVALFAITWPTYAFGWFGIGVGMFGGANLLIVGPALVIGIYLMHWFCWYLGLMYRAHHEEFPWVLQRHVRDPDRPRRQGTHADRLGRRRRPVGGHLPPLPTELPSPPPPPPRS